MLSRRPLPDVSAVWGALELQKWQKFNRSAGEGSADGALIIHRTSVESAKREKSRTSICKRWRRSCTQRHMGCMDWNAWHYFGAVSVGHFILCGHILNMRAGTMFELRRKLGGMQGIPSARTLSWSVVSTPVEWNGCQDALPCDTASCVTSVFECLRLVVSFRTLWAGRLEEVGNSH